MVDQMRSDEEIVERVKELSKSDPFGFSIENLVTVLPFEEAVKFFKVNAEHPPKDVWEAYRKKNERESIIERMKEYMPFAWHKAKSQRGLSASRSATHYEAWVWLLGDEDHKAIDWDNYSPYGEPVLRAICGRYDMPMPEGCER